LEEKLEAIKKAVSRHRIVMTADADEEAKEDTCAAHPGM